MEFKIKKRDIIPILAFILYVLGYLTVLVKFSMGTNESKLRYFLLAIGIIICSFCVIKRYGHSIIKKTKFNDLLLIFIVSLIFLIESYLIAKSYGVGIQTRTYVQIFLILGPILFAYLILNLLETKLIFNCLKFIFFISIIFYFFEPGHTLIDFLNFSNYINVFSSHFFAESSLFSEVFLQLFLFFNYFHYISKNEKIDVPSIYVFISGFFTLLCGKRLSILMVCVTPFINIFAKKRKNKTFSLKSICLLLILICYGTVLYSNMLQHKAFPEFDIYKFSTGRDYILSLWEKHNYVSYGYGTSMLLIGRYLELDLVEIYMELNVFCLVLFVAYFFKIGKKTNYGFIIILYSLMNMLTASSLPYSLGWLIIILSIKLIEESEMVLYEKS